MFPNKKTVLYFLFLKIKNKKILKKHILVNFTYFLGPF